ncbi:Kinase [Hexamita inflata]|uniref:CAMK CAMKL n=1 Tax=Hexamita inflata TaxID=28002 RepID=A0AA86QQL7_9EUKA|nr:CAMK CAMKL [Hexamita inflata]
MRGNTLYVQNYQILNKLDEGCEAAVFSALSSSNQIVALYHISNRSRALNRIQLHKISNSITGVVKMLDYFEIQQSALQFAKQYQILSNPGTIIIFEYLEGDSIDKCLLKHSPEEILDAINQLTTIIHQLHSHYIYHLDIKPDNVFYFDGQVTVLDFGSAQMLQKQTQKTEPILDFLFSSDECLTKVYESTKYFRSERDIQKQLVKPIVTQKYDVYSIGCIVFLKNIKNKSDISNLYTCKELILVITSKIVFVPRFSDSVAILHFQLQMFLPFNLQRGACTVVIEQGTTEGFQLNLK